MARPADSAPRRSNVRLLHLVGNRERLTPATALGPAPVRAREADALRSALDEVAATHESSVGRPRERRSHGERRQRQPRTGLAPHGPLNLVPIADEELRVTGAVAPLLPRIRPPAVAVTVEDKRPLGHNRGATNLPHQSQM